MRLKQLMFDHPGWIICSPEYNGSYTALLKNMIDWACSPFKGDPEWGQGTEAFGGKVVGLLSASPRRLGRFAVPEPFEPAAAQPAVLGGAPAVRPGQRRAGFRCEWCVVQRSAP